MGRYIMCKHASSIWSAVVRLARYYRTATLTSHTGDVACKERKKPTGYIADQRPRVAALRSKSGMFSVSVAIETLVDNLLDVLFAGCRGFE